MREQLCGRQLFSLCQSEDLEQEHKQVGVETILQRVLVSSFEGNCTRPYERPFYFEVGYYIACAIVANLCCNLDLIQEKAQIPSVAYL